MNPALKQLVELQELDTKYIQLRRRLKAGTTEVEKTAAKLEELREAAGDLEQEISQTRAAIDASELETKGIDAEVERLREKMKIIKNNREYTAIKSSINDANRRKEEAEAGELESMELLEELNSKVGVMKAEIKSTEAEYKKLSGEVKAEEEQLANELEAIKAERKQKAAAMDPDELRTYETVIRSNKGVAIINVINGTCQGCFSELSPNLANKVLGNNVIVRCEQCGRYLYSEPEAAAAEE